MRLPDKERIFEHTQGHESIYGALVFKQDVKTNRRARHINAINEIFAPFGKGCVDTADLFNLEALPIHENEEFRWKPRGQKLPNDCWNREGMTE
jgi:hypothetical protein